MSDEDMSPEDVAALFNEPVPVEKVILFPDEEIYAISARIKNAATLAVNTNLTQTGIQLCNCYTHVVKALYDFANTLSEQDRDRLKELIRKNEGMTAGFIVSANPPARREPLPTEEEQIDAMGGNSDFVKLVMATMQNPEMNRVIIPPDATDEQAFSAFRRSFLPDPKIWDTPVYKPNVFTRIKNWLLN